MLSEALAECGRFLFVSQSSREESLLSDPLTRSKQRMTPLSLVLIANPAPGLSRVRALAFCKKSSNAYLDRYHALSKAIFPSLLVSLGQPLVQGLSSSELPSSML